MVPAAGTAPRRATEVSVDAARIIRAKLRQLGADRAFGAQQSGRPGRRPEGKQTVGVLLALSRAIDRLNEQFGYVANWMVLLACLISAGNAFSRYLFSMSSNGWLEIQWYMFAAMVLLGGPYTLKMNEHVRVDLIYGMVSERTRIWIDIIGGLLFLLPICVILTYFTWPWFVDSWKLGEVSTNAGGLIRWPVKLLMPVGFALMALQGISEIIKRVAALEHIIDIEFKYEKPLQ
jgi:TRAP-type mannitol/chloroaromatic compound transport system permease small subunit